MNSQPLVQGGASSQVATPFQAGYEQAITLQSLVGQVPGALASVLTADPGSDTESLARRLILASRMGSDGSSLAAALLKNQDVSGGFGVSSRFLPNPLDTAWAVLALSEAGAGGGTAAVAARQWLASQWSGTLRLSLADGGQQHWGLFQTALMIAALRTDATLDVSGPVGAVLALQGSDGAWSGDGALTAWVWLGIGASVTSPAVKSRVRSFLAAQQLADGSWQKDVYVSALALRALQGIYVQQGAALSGLAVDQSSRLPLNGVTVRVRSGALDRSLATDATGTFALDSLDAGDYTITLDKGGYTGLNVQVHLGASQQVDLGTLAMAPVANQGTLRGVVTDASTGQALSGATLSLAGAPVRTATTAADGSYEFSGVPVGALTVQATKSGYQSVQGSGLLEAGSTLVFSPALYPNGSTVSGQGVFKGRAVDAVSRAPLAGVSVAVTGKTPLVSGVDGRFNASLAAQQYSVTYTLDGYRSVTQRFLLSGGTTVDAGDVALSRALSVSSLGGYVRNSSGQPVAGATIKVNGLVAATAGSDGAFLVQNLSGLRFDIDVSSPGYVPQASAIYLNEPSDYVQNFSLISEQPGNLVIGALAVTPGSVPGETLVTVNADVSNPGDDGVEASFLLQIRDSTDRVVSTGSVVNGVGQPLGVQTFPGHLTVPVKAVWRSGQYPPGQYYPVLLAIAKGSANRSNPVGQVLGESRGSVTVVADLRIGGGLVANPPVSRAGSTTPIKLYADIKNTGNSDLPAQTYRMTVTRSTGEQVYSETVSGATLPIAQVMELTFPDWLPKDAGNYALDLVSADSNQGHLSGSVYVGTSPMANFTVTPDTVSVGTQIVHAKVHVSGEDPLQGSIKDPLATAIVSAVKKAVVFNDQAATTWTVNNGCQGCHIQTQALVSGEVNAAIVPDYDSYQRSVIFNNTSTNQRSNGSLDAGYNGYYPLTQTTLGLWSLNAAQRKENIALTIMRAANYLVSRQQGTGYWAPDYNAGWWGSYVAHASLNLRSLVATYDLVKSRVGQIVQYGSEAKLTPPSKLTGYVTADPQGGYYLSLNNNTVVHYGRDGVLLETWNLSAVGRGMAVVPGGQALMVATGSGVYALTPGGGVARFSTVSNLGDLAYGPDGRLYGSVQGGSSITVIDGSGVGSTYVSSGQIYYPGGLSFDQDGSLLIANANTRLVKVLTDKSVVPVLGQCFGCSYLDVKPDASGWLVTTNTGLYHYNRYWEGEQWLFSSPGRVAVLAGGEVVFACSGDSALRKLDSSLADTDSALLGYRSAIGAATSWLLANPQQSSTNNLDVAQQLYGLDAARRFVQATDATAYATITAQMNVLAATLKSRQRADGGWGLKTGYGSDSMVTAQVGMALDTLNPSGTSPELRKAINWLLGVQGGDGAWVSQNGILNTKEAATTWVSIWLPTMLDRLGAIDTTLSLDFPPTVQMSGAIPLPDTTSSATSGNVNYQWKLPGVKAAGVDVSFDLTLAELGYNETRGVASDAYLAFNNSFTGSEEHSPVLIPAVTAVAGVALGAKTDKAVYGANEVVHGTVTLRNGNARAASGWLTILVEDQQGTVIATYNQGSVLLPAQSGTDVSVDWYTRLVLVGGYSLHGVLQDDQGLGQTLAEARAAFDVVASGKGVTGSVGTDKRYYAPTATVVITGKAFNLADNQLTGALTLRETVKDGSGNVLLDERRSIGQLPGGGAVAQAFRLLLTQASAGDYGVVQQILDGAGNVQDERQAVFRVQSSNLSGQGLGGDILAAPKAVRPGETVSFAAHVYNQGNTALVGLPLVIYVLDPDAGTVLARFPTTRDVGIGATQALPGVSWPASGRVGASYLVVLTATVDGTQLTLAQDSFQLLAPVAAGITATGGTPQGAPAGTAYPVALEATVRDTLGQVMAGATVSFAAPADGPGVSFPDGNQAVTDAQGRAAVRVQANASVGAFTVVATASGVASEADFQLSNLAPVAAQIEALRGTPQRGAVSHRFGLPLTARVLDTTGQPMAGVMVTFVASGGVPGILFPNGNRAVTNDAGEASIVAKGGAQTGTAMVSASAPRANGVARFDLTLDNLCGTPEPVRFTPLVEQPVSTLVISEPVTIQGIGQGCTASLVVAGGAYRLVRNGVVLSFSKGRSRVLGKAVSNAAEFSSEPTAIQDGDQVTLAQVTASEYRATTQIRADFGDVAASWPVTTLDVGAGTREVPSLDFSGLVALVLVFLGLAGRSLGRDRGLWRPMSRP